MKTNFDISMDLHGIRAEYAEKRLKDALYSGANRGKTLLVIHGCGNGILREMVRRVAKRCPLVHDVWAGEEYNLAGFAGVTAIFL